MLPNPADKSQAIPIRIWNFRKFDFFFKICRSPYLTRRPNFYPLYFQPNELRLCIHLKIKGLPSGFSTRMKTNLHIFHKIQKTMPILCGIAMPFWAPYSLGEYYVGRRGKPSTWLPRQKLAEERMLERGEVSWVFPNVPEQFLIEFEIFNNFQFFNNLARQISKPFPRVLPPLFSSKWAETLQKFQDRWVD